jgi:hypothetical protein
VSNIADLTRNLREEIRKQYGVEAHIEIKVYGHWHENSHIRRDSAGQIALAMAHIMGAETRHNDFGKAHWVSVEPPYEKHVEATIFYPGVVSQ